MVFGQNFLTHTMYLFIILHAFSRRFYPNDLQCIQVIHFLSVCVPGNRTHNLLTQCSTTEPQEIVLLAIATNIPELMTGFVIQGHIWSQ